MNSRNTYSRDARSPTPLNETTSKSMSGNKGKDTKPELLVRTALWRYGLRGYRLHPKQVPGRPDICYIRKKIAIFVNGCFWHRCPYCKYGLPKNNRFFWKQKFRNNVDRDERNILLLRKASWKVLVIWECQLKPDRYLKTVQKVIEIVEKQYNKM